MNAFNCREICLNSTDHEYVYDSSTLLGAGQYLT